MLRAAMRKGFVLAGVLGATTTVSAVGAAQGLAGTFRTTRDEVTVTVRDWGEACGPRPSSQQLRTGREVTVRQEGSQLVLSGARTYRTDRCWSDNRDVRALVQAAVGNRWTVSCATPEGYALGERGTYTLTAVNSNRLSFRDETEYEWSIQGATCRASSVHVREYERVGDSAAQPTPTPTPTPEPRPAPTPTPAVERPPSRCARPGAATALQISPSRRSTTAGGRVCFRARFVDANRCETDSREALSWAVARRRGEGEARMEGTCFVSTSAGATGEFEVTAEGGGFRDQALAAVVSEEDFRGLVAAQLETDDAGVSDAPGPAQTVGVSVGGGGARGRGVPLWPLVGGAAVLAGLVTALLARRKPKRSAPPSEPQAFAPAAPPSSPEPARVAGVTSADGASQGGTGRNRREAFSIPASAVVSLAKAERDARIAAVAPRRCPKCQRRFAEELAFCPDDGAHLELEGGAPVAEVVAPVAAQPASAAPQPMRRCAKCGRQFEAHIAFCGEDGTPLG